MKDRYRPRERGRATAEDIQRYRENLPYLEYSLTMIGEDGIRYTFCAPGIAQGIFLSEWVGISFHSTFNSNGAKWAKGGQLETLERYVYEGERRKIVREMIEGISKMKDPGPEFDFFRVMETAINRTDELRRDLFPIPKRKPQQLEIRPVRGVWWLLHPAWMPLVFDSFEEAVSFANRYIVRRQIPRTA